MEKQQIPEESAEQKVREFYISAVQNINDRDTRRRNLSSTSYFLAGVTCISLAIAGFYSGFFRKDVSPYVKNPKVANYLSAKRILPTLQNLGLSQRLKEEDKYALSKLEDLSDSIEEVSQVVKSDIKRLEQTPEVERHKKWGDSFSTWSYVIGLASLLGFWGLFELNDGSVARLNKKREKEMQKIEDKYKIS